MYLRYIPHVVLLVSIDSRPGGSYVQRCRQNSDTVQSGAPYRTYRPPAGPAIGRDRAVLSPWAGYVPYVVDARLVLFVRTPCMLPWRARTSCTRCLVITSVCLGSVESEWRRCSVGV